MSAESILHYRFPDGGRTLAVRLRVPRLRTLLESFYDQYRAGPSEGVEPTISLEREDGSYRLIGPSGDWEAADEGEAVLYYESELTGALLEDAGAFVHLHGAAVCRGASCTLLVGPSGAGKSTLTLGLYLRGLSALADDALLIDPASGEDAGDVRGARVCKPYLWLSPRPAGAGDSGPRRPTAMVFLESAGAAALERLGAAEVLRLLLLARLGDAARRDFDCLARLAVQVPGYALAYGDFSEAVDERPVNVRPEIPILLHAHAMELDPLGEPRADSFEDVDGEILSGRQGACGAELFGGGVDVPVVKASHDLGVEQAVELGELHDHAGLGIDRPADGHLAAVVVTVTLRGRGLAEASPVFFLAPVRPVVTVRGREVDGPCQIADRHSRSSVGRVLTAHLT